ncbi:MAG TPA: PEP-CTERM sorting domain-containing protein [Bryocella sp.]|nr:PEP-CTERM sorting domain-containing protein [Bryocella sp.]
MSKHAIGFAVIVAVLAVPAYAQTFYSNGPINGTTDAWTINFGFVVSESFTSNGGGSPIEGLAFGAWLFPGDVLETAQVTITSSAFGTGGITYFSQFVNFSQSGCSANQYGFNVCTETADFSGPTLNSGTYWLSLSNAVVNTGDPVYWDENSGPSRAFEDSLGTLPLNATAVGTIPSEAFTILGETTFASSTTPEPDSLILLCSGGMTLFGFLAWRTRKRF